MVAETPKWCSLEVDAGDPSWSFDGRYLAFTQSHPDTGEDIWVLPFGEEASPFLVTAADEGAPRFSPDDRWIVYMSNESGDDEIYVRPFPGPGGRWQVSSDGGTEPVWSLDGREVFYRDGADIVVVDVDTSEGFDYGRPRTLFTSDEFRRDLSGHPSYDVSPDARSFVMIQEASDEPLTEIHVVFNWFQELERLVPTGE